MLMSPHTQNLRPRRRVGTVCLLLLLSVPRARAGTEELERLRPLFHRKGFQGGGSGGLVKERLLDGDHSVALVYINDEQQPDTHGVFVVDRHTREPVLTLGFMAPDRGLDTCREIVSASRKDVVISTGSCDYGGDDRTRFKFSLASSRVRATRGRPPELPALGSEPLFPKLCKRVLLAGESYVIAPSGIYRGSQAEPVFELPGLSEKAIARAGLSFWVHLENSTEVHSFVVRDGRIWVGLEVYDGEGAAGIGGLGFYDTRTSEAGLLRHPVLVERSVVAFDVTPELITVVNEPRGEFIPSQFTDVQVIRIARGHLTVEDERRPLPDWRQADHLRIRRRGADRVMIERYAWEHAHALFAPKRDPRLWFSSCPLSDRALTQSEDARVATPRSSLLPLTQTDVVNGREDEE